MDQPPLKDLPSVLSEYHAPWPVPSVSRHNDLCRSTLAWWARRKGAVVEIAPDGKALLSVRCVNAVGEETLARAYEGTEDQCLAELAELRERARLEEWRQ